MSAKTAKLRSTVENEPVALAAAIRTLLYAFLGTRLDARTLTELVVVAEVMIGIVVRGVVTPTKRQTRKPKRTRQVAPSADTTLKAAA